MQICPSLLKYTTTTHTYPPQHTSTISKPTHTQHTPYTRNTTFHINSCTNTTPPTLPPTHSFTNHLSHPPIHLPPSSNTHSPPFTPSRKALLPTPQTSHSTIHHLPHTTIHPPSIPLTTPNLTPTIMALLAQFYNTQPSTPPCHNPSNPNKKENTPTHKPLTITPTTTKLKHLQTIHPLPPTHQKPTQPTPQT